MVTTKDLREMCQNGVTLEDLRRLYGVDATLEDLELALPSLLIGDLGILPCSEEAIQGLSECQEESQDAGEEEVSSSQDAMEEEINPIQNIMNREISSVYNINNDKEILSQNAMEEKIIYSQVEKTEATLPLLSSMDQQPVAKEMKAEVPSYYNPLLYTVPSYPLLALYLLSQSSNALDVLISLEILSHLI